MYGALTDTIRKLLLDHKMLTTVTKRREAYTEFLRRLWGDEASKDVVFSVHGEEVRAHRFLLSTRCPQLRTMFEVDTLTETDALQLIVIIQKIDPPSNIKQAQNFVLCHFLSK